ncbi:hypothetical protein DWB68_07555 [Galactobacter valiniphilus]|uniref:Htaa domain-containing protein n=1 Tax=Galactobacter valiniphilus TaxID=2676122 RepID=A0A399J9X0_9MICC|nr:HtaA domain-containing protein [Galactobacter valiniphilus]RII42401.1 hypothetical protein DWB68_07555 [Galactobacter valiniphilus]
MSSTPPRKGWRRALSALTALAVAGLGLAGTAAPAHAAGGENFAPATAVSVVSASAADGLKLNISGTGYLDMPNSSIGYNAGLYVAPIVHGSDPSALAQGAPSSFVKTAAITDGAWSTELTVPTSVLSKGTDYDIVVWRAHGLAVGDAVMDLEPIKLTAANVNALFPPKNESSHSIKVDAAAGLTVNVAGSDYDTTKYPAGVHVAVIDRELAYSPTPPQSSYLGTGSVASVATDFSVSTLAIAATALDKSKDYDVIVWPRRTNPSAANVAYRANLEFTDAQKEALFPSPVDRTITVTGKDFINLPASSMGYNGKGAYVGFFPKGTDLSTVTQANLGTKAVATAYVAAASIDTKGNFTSKVTIPAAAAAQDLEVTVWTAHGLPVGDAIVVNKQALAQDATSITLTGPGEPETPELTAPDTKVQVTKATATDGLALQVDGSNYTNLPKPSSPMADGIYAAIVVKGAGSAVSSSAPGTQWLGQSAIATGSFSTSLGLSTAQLVKGTDYEVLTWAAHGSATEATIISRVGINLTDAQKTALFGTGTTDPETPEAKDRKISITGTKFTGLPSPTMGGTANGLYVAIVPQGTKAEDIADGTTVAQDWIMGSRIKDGGFVTTLTVPAVKAAEALEVITWSAHGKATAATVIDRQALPATATSVALTGPGKPAPVDPEGPETPVDPETPGTDNGSDEELTISNATLNWGLKKSFRDYVVGPIGGGKLTVSDGAKQAAKNGVFSFTGGSGTLKNGLGTISFNGTVNVTGHEGEMDLTFSQLRVKVTGPTKAELIASVTAPKTSMTDAINLKDVVLASLSFDAKNLTFNNAALGFKAAVSASKLLVLSDAKATLTKAGVPALAGFYEAGTVLDAVSVNADAKNSGTTTAGDDEADNESTAGSTDGEKTTSGNTAANSGAAKQQCRTVTVPATAGGVSLSWGVKSSFVSYVKGGIAKGQVTTGNGAAASGSGFTWGAGSGSLSANGTGTVSFPGSVHFTGHDGLLDTTLSGLRVQVTGSGTAALIANVKSQDMEGKDLSASNITFATVKFSGGSASGFSGASVTLTAAGAKAFAGFYNAGQAMDSMTLSVGKASAATTQVVCGDLAATGVDNTANLVGTAGLLALLGAAAITLAARRKSAADQR